MVDLYRDGLEFISWPISDLPDDAGALEVELDGAWHGLTKADDNASAGLFLAGPDVPLDEIGPAYQIVGVNDNVRVRVTDSPEIIPRPGGRVRLLSDAS